MKNIRWTAFVCVAGCALLAPATTLTVNVDAGQSQTDFTAEQITAIQALTAEDEICKTGGGALLITTANAIGAFKGTLRISDGCYVPQRNCFDYDSRASALGCAGEARVIVESGATLFFDLYTEIKSNSYWGVKIRLNGSGYAGQPGALVLGGQWNGSTQYNGFYPVGWDVVLDGPTTIAKGGSPGYFASDCSLDMNGYDLTVVNDPGLKGLASVANAGKIVRGSDRLDVSSTGAVLAEVNVAAGVVQTNLTAQQLAAVKASCWNETRGGLLKTGDGVLRVCKNYGLHGTAVREVHLTDGVYVSSSKAAGPFGSSAAACTVYVSDGASLYFNEYCAGSSYIDGLTLHLAGAGHPGIGGALVLGGNWDPGDTEWYGMYPYDWKVTLDADATVMRGYSNGYFGDAAGKTRSTLDLQGHVLTINNTFTPVKDANEGFDLRGVATVLNPGRIVVDGARTMKMGGTWSGTGDIVLTNGAALSFQPGVTAAGWTIRSTDNFTLRSYKTGGTWDGTVEIADGKTLTLATDGSTDFYVPGTISGNGNVNVNGNSWTRIYLSGANTYTGTTTLSGGNLVLMNKNAVPGWADPAKLVGSKESYRVIAYAQQTAARPDGWTAAEMWEIIKRYRYNGTADRNWSVGAYVDNGTDFVIDCDFAEKDEGLSYTNFCAMTFQTFGGGRAVLRGDYPTAVEFAPFKVSHGVSWGGCLTSNLVYSVQANGHPMRPVSLTFTEVDVTLENLGYFWMGSWRYAYMGGKNGDYTLPCYLTVGTNTCTDCIHGNGGRALYACGDYDNVAAVIRLEPGGIISNNVWLASAEAATHTGTAGAYVQNGGALRSFLPMSAQNSLTVGGSRRSMGYAEINAGEFSVGPLGLYLGNWLSSHVLFHQKGGDFSAESVYARGGNLQMRFSGGTAQVKNKMGVPVEGGYCGNTNGYMELVVDGAATPLFAGGLQLGSRLDSTGVVTCAGTSLTKTPFVTRTATTPTGKQENPNGRGWVNFAGGGLCATLDGAELLGAGDAAVDAATVYPAGAVLAATSGVTATVSVPLARPAGKGLAKLAYPLLPVKTAPAAGRVIITGDGEGAVAAVNFDSTKWGEKITGFTVISPGTGYTWMKAELFRGTVYTNLPLTVTLADNAATGGLVKKDAGTIVLNAANTYGGATRVEAGTLRAAVADAIPSGSAVTIVEGGLLSLASGVPYPADVTVDVADWDAAKRYPIIACDDARQTKPVVKGLSADPRWQLLYRRGAWTALVPKGCAVMLR